MYTSLRMEVQCSSLIMLCLGSIGMDCFINGYHVIKEQFYKTIIGK